MCARIAVKWVWANNVRSCNVVCENSFVRYTDCQLRSFSILHFQFSTLYAEGALLCVADISRCGLNFFCVIFALFQIVFQLDIAIAVGGILANNVLILVFDQETHARNRVFRHAVNLLDADAGHLGIFKFHSGQFTSLYNNILRICVDTVAIGSLDLGYDIDAVLQTGNVDQTGRIGGILTDALTGHLLDLEFRACECIAGTLNHLADLQTICLLLVKVNS